MSNKHVQIKGFYRFTNGKPVWVAEHGSTRRTSDAPRRPSRSSRPGCARMRLSGSIPSTPGPTSKAMGTFNSIRTAGALEARELGHSRYKRIKGNP